MRHGDASVTYVDNCGLEEDYGLKPKVDIRTGLRKFCEWYEGYR